MGVSLSDNFLGLESPSCDYESARFALLPIPYDATTSFAPGTRDGPRAVIAASLTPFWLSIGSELIGGSADTGGLSWIPETSAKQLYSVLTTLAGGGGTPLLALSLVLVSGGLVVAAATWLRCSPTTTQSDRYSARRRVV